MYGVALANYVKKVTIYKLFVISGVIPRFTKNAWNYAIEEIIELTRD